ncbi:MAG: DUF4013 domain-containing protein [Aigarchaeota archaeon]|nr:DUF4013 domain-containing protein [Aigarchaeota archaeon]
MDIGKNLGEAYQYAVKLFSDGGRLLVLVILSIIPIVNFITLGYLARVIRETPSRGDPPKLEDYGDMWVEGLKIVVAYIIYGIIPVVLIGLAVIPVFVVAAITGGPWGVPFFAIPVTIVLIIIGIALMFFIFIVVFMGVAHMVKNRSFGKAFAFREIISIIGRVGWGSYILWVIIIFVISLIYGAVIGALVVGIPIIGWLIALALYPVYGVFLARSVGLIYAEATGERALPPAAEAPI